MKNLDGILKLVEGFGSEEKKLLVKQIMSMMEASSDKKGCGQMVEETKSGRPNCPHCSANSEFGYIVKRGTNRNGAQRYYCKKCGSIFVCTTNTAFERSHKSADVWMKFIEMTISGASLKNCAEECGIAYQTAFTWRHKLLNVFEVNQEQIKLDGKVEVDEMLVPVSYKGNHVQGPFGERKRKSDAVNDMPRKSYRRGTDNKSRSSKDKACVFCMVENGSKAFYAAVPGVGFMSEQMLNATVAKHVNKESAMMLADDYKITKNYFEQNGYRHMILLSNTSDNPKDHKPEVRDGHHLQHVNAMHHHIRNFLRPYCGVSSKYLSGYISMFIWLKSVGRIKNRKKADKVTLTRAAASDCYISRKELENRPAVPSCA